ncbi:BppU family phage baseplate upper protein [Mammaliicoccus sp. F-M27]|uniref:BppU family phage baseplate upper protein n=1 Tax=Mammaliicoccus sp. F-M27 TaxID=2898687 RepID=UPI001EFBE587|nr:BppU family phage baseplate upper protein [Mammaliicoccus sp. F-M27]
MVNFNAAPNKKAKLVLETTPFKQIRSDLNVAFSTADRNTSIFEFIVTQNNKPLLLGNDNITSSIVFIHSKGLKIRLPLEITDGMNGKISVQVPNDIITLSGKVTAQVYVARKSTTETQAIVAERIFSFVIEESLAYDFDGETKLNYIIEFDELEEQLKQRAYDIEQAIANAEDYVAKIIQAKDEGLSDISIAKTSSLNELNTLATNKLGEITTEGTQYVTNLTQIRDDIDGKINQFNSDVIAGGYVKDADTTEWQKHSVTDDEGHSIQIETIDFMNVGETITKSGLYYINSSTNGPIDETPYGYITANFTNVDNGQLVFTPVGSYKIYSIQKVNGTWEGLHDLTQDMETQNGAQLKSDTAYNNAITYFDDKLNANFKSLWKGNVSEKGTVIDLLEPYTNYKMLYVVYYSIGGTKNTSRFVEGMERIVIQDFNLSDADGGASRFFETALDVINTTQLSVRHNHTYLPETNTGISNSNAIEYREIVGVY